MNENIDLSIDLNIDNYNLTDLLSLFKLDYNFNTDDLKQAKKIVMMTHPDKSNLDKKYFLFFTKAFKVIHSIHQFRTRSDKQRSTDYNPEDEGEEESDKEKEKLIRAISKKPNFNKAFNEFFDTHTHVSFRQLVREISQLQLCLFFAWDLGTARTPQRFLHMCLLSKQKQRVIFFFSF